MSIWSELDGAVTFHEKDHISIEKCFKDVLFNEHGFECIFSYTQPQSKWNDKVTSCFISLANVFVLRHLGKIGNMMMNIIGRNLDNN